MQIQSILLVSAFALLTNSAGAVVKKQLSDNMLDIVDHFEHNPTTSAVLNKLRLTPQVLKTAREKIKIKKQLLVDGFHDAVKTARKQKSERIDEWLKAMLLKGEKGHAKLFTAKWTPDKIFSRFRLHEIEDKLSDPMYIGFSKYYDQWVKWRHGG
uniref:RxLR effector protein n=1 Tax=Peronospora matthiolae TaxID=2874970 RepID=A0AAV1TKS6_9STRA